jgi:peptide deformylase
MTQKVKYYKGDLVKYEIYKLVDYYDPILREPTIPFSFEQTEQFFKAEYIAFSLAETLNTMQGLGLSANQVGLKERVCAVNMGEQIWVMFNPEIISKVEAPAEYAEGCLSYPGLYLKLNRPKHIKVRFQAIGGQVVEQEFDGLTAVCVQHEIDHLDGKLFTDHVSPIKLEQAKRKVKKNLKKMRDYNKQYAAAQVETEEVSKPESAPSIQIMNDNINLDLNPQKKPEKFLYNIDN